MDAVTLLRAQLEAAHALSGQVVSGLTPDQIHWQPAGLAHPIGATYAHVVLNEDWVVHTFLKGGAPLYETAWVGRTGFSSSQPRGGGPGKNGHAPCG
jgi:hypothetical protein